MSKRILKIPTFEIAIEASLLKRKEAKSVNFLDKL